MSLVHKEILLIEHAVFAHYLSLYQQLSDALKDKFEEPESEYPQCLFNMKLRTHLGNNNCFWYPLFNKMKGVIKLRGFKPTNDELWDLILPIGYASLKEIEKTIPSHAYNFPETGKPKLFDEEKCRIELYKYLDYQINEEIVLSESVKKRA